MHLECEPSSTAALFERYSFNDDVYWENSATYDQRRWLWSISPAWQPRLSLWKLFALFFPSSSSFCLRLSRWRKHRNSGHVVWAPPQCRWDCPACIPHRSLSKFRFLSFQLRLCQSPWRNEISNGGMTGRDGWTVHWCRDSGRVVWTSDGADSFLHSDRLSTTERNSYCYCSILRSGGSL